MQFFKKLASVFRSYELKIVYLFGYIFCKHLFDSMLCPVFAGDIGGENL